MPQVELYTKGAANDVLGAWAYILVSGEHQKQRAGTMLQASPNTAGLEAVIQGLRAIKQPCEVTLFTSSTYIMSGFAILNAGTEHEYNRFYWYNLAKVMSSHTLEVRYCKVANCPLLQTAYDLAVDEIHKAMGIEKVLP